MNFKKLIYRYIKEISPFKSAVIAVVISVTASVIVSAVSAMGRQIINSEMDAMGMNGLAVSLYNSNGENVTDNYFYQNITSVKGTQSATPVIINNAELKFTNGTVFNAMGWGINEQAADIVCLQITEGRMINKLDISSNAMVCLIDENIAEQVYRRSNICGKKIYISIGNRTAVFEVIGTVKKGSTILNNLTGDVIPDFIYIPYTTMKNFSDKPGYDQILFTSTDSNELPEQFKQKLSDISYSYRNKTINITNLSQQKEQIINIVDAAFLSLFLVSCVAVLVCSISVASSVNTAVITKQKDIGIKISMGASRINIVSEFILSAVSACCTGIFTALLCIIPAFYLISHIFTIEIAVDTSLIVYSISAILVLTAIFSLLPSYKAANMPPIKALNRE